MKKDDYNELQEFSSNNLTLQSALQFTNLSHLLPTFSSAKTTRSTAKSGQEKTPLAVASTIFLILLNLGIRIKPEQEKGIQRYISKHYSAALDAIFLGLFQKKLVSKNTMVHLLIDSKSPLNTPLIKSWWAEEKNRVRTKFASEGNSTKVANHFKLQDILNNKLTEKEWVARFKNELTKFARENFYTYKSGHTYYYSTMPDEESIGGRCDMDGKPLTDEYGNALTDEFGNFQYALIDNVEISPDVFTERKTLVPQATEGATALTDNNGVPLANKYYQIISQDKPKQISKARAEAVNYLMELLDITSAEQVYRYLCTDNLQTLIGSNELNLQPWKTSLAYICKQFVKQYTGIVTRIADNRVLDIVLDEKLFLKLSNEHLTQLLLRCNPWLVAEAIVNLYQREDFVYKDIDFDCLKNFLNGDQQALLALNLKRCELKTKVILPPDSRLPGKNIFEQETLTKHQLFQYNEKTIAALEDYFRNNFYNLIINLGKGVNDQLNQAAPYYFYLIPSNSYMLLDPTVENNPNYYRYLNLKRNLLPLVNDHRINCFNKPVIICSIFNIDGNHYIPCFIYNHEGKVTVITVDPSPITYPEEIKDVFHLDTKTETYKKIKEIFQDLLPGCECYDPFITQMLRERDCGPNSAQTLADAFVRAMTETPLLTISEGKLLIDTHQLSICGYPNGINPYTKTYTYPSIIELNSNINRANWQQRLSKVTLINFHSRPTYLEQAPLSVVDAWEILSEDYSYLDEVDGQTLHDERNVNISAIQSILLSEERGRSLISDLIEHYKSTLQIPNLIEFVDYIKSKCDHIQLQQYTSAHQHDLLSLLEDVAAVILKDYIGEAFCSALKLELSNIAPAPDLDCMKIVEAFLNKNYVLFKKLPPHDQIILNEKLKNISEATIKQKLIKYHTEVVKDLINRNCYYYLCQLVADTLIRSKKDLGEALLRRLAVEEFSFFIDYDTRQVKNGVYWLGQRSYPTSCSQSLVFLRDFDYLALKDIVLDSVSTMAHKILVATMDLAKQRLNLAKFTLHDLLLFFDTEQRLFLPPQPASYLSEERKPYLLSIQDTSSLLGAWLLPRLDQLFYRMVIDLIQYRIHQKVEVLFQDLSFNQAIMKLPLVSIDSWLDDDNHLIGNFNFLPYLDSFGDQQSITRTEYHNVIAHPFVKQALQQGIEKLLTAMRSKIFRQIADQILDQNTEQLTIAEIYRIFDFGQDFTTSLFSITLANNPELNEFFDQQFSVNNPEKKSYSLCGLRFYHFFKNTCSSMIIGNHTLATAFVRQLKDTVCFLTSYNQRFVRPDLNKLVNNCIREIQDITESLSALPLTAFFDSKLQILKNLYNKTILKVAADLTRMKEFCCSELHPGSISVINRSLICTLLGVKTPAILTPVTVEEIETKIFDILSNDNYKIHDVKESSLIVLEETNNVPDTYNKSLTIELIKQLIAFWFTNRPYGSNIKYLFLPDKLPPLISRLIRLINECHAKSEFDNQQLMIVYQDLFSNPKLLLEIFSATDPTLQVAASLLKTRELAGIELNETNLSFTELDTLLKGKEVDFSAKKQKRSRSVLSLVEFNQKIVEIYQQRMREANLPARDNDVTESTSSPSQVHLEDIEKELAQVFDIEGREVTPIISRAEFEKKVVNETIKRKQALKLQQLSEEELAQVSATITFNSVRKDLAKQYEVETVNQEEEEEEDNIEVNVPRATLQRRGLRAFSFFGNTPLDKALLNLKARHPAKDYLDEWDLNQLKLQLIERWHGIYQLESMEAPWNHYLQAKPDYQDSQCILIAGKLAKYYQRRGERVCVYELLMPGFFPPSASLKSHQLPVKILQELNEVAVKDIVYDVGKESKATLDLVATIDDIPLPNLIITRSGYAFDIHWIIRAYVQDSSLINLYTQEEFSQEEIEDILLHPSSKQLIAQVKINRIPSITPRAIDLLEEYIIGTVYMNGFYEDYNKEEQGASELAAQKFYDALKLIPKERKALMAELIPRNQDNATVESILKDSISCIAYQGVQLSKVVLAYKGAQNRLPVFIREMIRNPIEQRQYYTSQGVVAETATDLERYILKASEAKEHFFRFF